MNVFRNACQTAQEQANRITASNLPMYLHWSVSYGVQNLRICFLAAHDMRLQ